MWCAIIFLLLPVFATYAEDPRDPWEGGFKSLLAISRPSSQTFDKYGNILLNGRIGENPSHFRISSYLQEEAELSVVFCLDYRNTTCGDAGLALCYPFAPNTTFDAKTDLTFKQKYIRDVCLNMNGVLVSTTVISDDVVFQVDTVFGNTYNFKVPNHKCFVLWLTYGKPVPSDNYKTFEDYRVNAITIQNDVYDVNSTTDSLDYKPNWKQVAVGLDHKYIWMRQKEITTWPKADKKLLTMPFVAMGGDQCCAITARIMGRYLSKCYNQWIRVGEECRARNFGDTVECEIPYTVGRKNLTTVHSSSSYSDAKTEKRRNQTYEHSGKNTHDYIDVATARAVITKTLRDVIHNVSSEFIDAVLLNVTGTLHLDASIDINKLHIWLEATIGGHYFSDQSIANSSVYLVDVWQNFTDVFNENLKQVQDNNMVDDGRERVNEGLGSEISEHITKDVQSALSEHRAEFHIVRNVVTWPDALRLGQLHFICHDEVWALNVTADFGNNKQLLEEVHLKEIEMGYPDPSVYNESCSNNY